MGINDQRDPTDDPKDEPRDERVRGARRIDQIRAVAERLFRDKGYLATSMRDIADAVQMRGGGSLYAHIKGKEDLLWTIASEATDAFFAALEPVIRASLPPDQKLREAIIRHVTVITEHLSAAAVYFDEWRHLTEPRRSTFLQRRDAYERLFGSILDEGLQAGVFRCPDPRLAALHLLSAMNAIRHWYRPDGRLPASVIANGLADMLLNGLCT